MIELSVCANDNTLEGKKVNDEIENIFAILFSFSFSSFSSFSCSVRHIFTKTNYSMGYRFFFIHFSCFFSRVSFLMKMEKILNMNCSLIVYGERKRGMSVKMKEKESKKVRMKKGYKFHLVVCLMKEKNISLRISSEQFNKFSVLLKQKTEEEEKEEEESEKEILMKIQFG